MATVVEIRDLTIAYGNGPPVLSGFSAALPEHSFTCVVGSSGVGKSTLLRVVAELVAPAGGEVVVPDRGHDETSRPFALVFQEPRLLPWRRVIDNVMFGLEGLRLSRSRRLARAQEALALVGLAEHAGRWPYQLSGGQRQRVNLARALAVRPRLLLLDEPFSALDAITRHSLQGELLRLARETGTSFLFVTHDLDEAVFLADRVIVLGGRPARVTRDFAVTLAHPRQREALDYVDHVRSLREALTELMVDGSGI
ncbi:MAG: ABC transporter ATP-binding protein [Rhodospirillaceae bacterium]